jgi:hypothetical protein
VAEVGGGGGGSGRCRVVKGVGGGVKSSHLQKLTVLIISYFVKLTFYLTLHAHIL